MKKFLVLVLFACSAFAAEGPVDRWAKAAGGREKVAAIQSIYREGKVRFQGMDGTIRVWRAADGRYRKEEQVGPYASVETFDGKTATIQRGATAPRTLTGPELEVALGKSYANSNAIFFVFFPERRRGSLTADADTITFKPDGGIEWRVTLDAETSLPKTMTHTEGDHTITVSFVSFETIDGLTLENEIHRSAGDPRLDADIHFTKTVINAPIDASMFTIAAK